MDGKMFSYTRKEVPQDYTCSKCGVSGVKMWRQYNSLACYVELLCVDCALKDQKKKYFVREDGRHKSTIGGWVDQIEWLIPAVPTQENDTFWGYTSVPQDGCDWWYGLPLRNTHA